MVIDCNLNRKEHIERVNPKAAKSIVIMYNLKESLTVKSMKLLYNSLVFPYINYCLEVWGTTYQSNIHSVYIMQKKSIT